MKKLYFYILWEFVHYPQFFYKMYDGNLENNYSSSSELLDDGFKEVEYLNHSDLNYWLNQWLDNLYNVQIDGVGIAETLKYDGISLWQFVKEDISKQVRMPVKIILYAQKLIDCYSVDTLVCMTDKNLPIIEASISYFNTIGNITTEFLKQCMN